MIIPLIDGDPQGAERLGIVLDPEVDYERRPDGGGGYEGPLASPSWTRFRAA